MSSILRSIMGRYDSENQLFHAAPIITESLKDLVMQYNRLKIQWYSPEFADWFDRNHVNKFKTKLILAARRKMGLGKTWPQRIMSKR